MAACRTSATLGITVPLGVGFRAGGRLGDRADRRLPPWGSVQDRQQVPQFVMNAPTTIEYRWTKENRIQVNAAPSDLANVPLTVGAGVTNTGSGEFWFPDGTAIRLSAPEKPASPVGYQVSRASSAGSAT